MAVETISQSSTIVIEVLIPGEIPEDRRAKFESAVLQFLFGADRLRPELAEAVREHGADPNHLAFLSAREKIGVCPDPDAHEFIPGPILSRLAAERGLSFTRGGSVCIEFSYDSKFRHAPNTLTVNLRLAPGLATEITREATAELVGSLFGDCQLSVRAQEYLRAHGIDLVELAAEHHKVLRMGHLPPTTRVRPEVAALLNEHGFNVDQFGRLEVSTIDDLRETDMLDEAGMPQGPRMQWTKTTCC